MEFEKLKKIIAEVLNVDEEEISMETTFVDDLGADSLDVFQIIMGLEEEFDIEIPNEEAEKIVTVGDADLKISALDIGIVSKSFEIKLIKCIACIRNQLAKKNLLVCVNRVDHQIKQPLGFRFKLFL